MAGQRSPFETPSKRAGSSASGSGGSAGAVLFSPRLKRGTSTPQSQPSAGTETRSRRVATDNSKHSHSRQLTAHRLSLTTACVRSASQLSLRAAAGPVPLFDSAVRTPARAAASARVSSGSASNKENDRRPSSPLSLLFSPARVDQRISAAADTVTPDVITFHETAKRATGEEGEEEEEDEEDEEQQLQQRRKGKERLQGEQPDSRGVVRALSAMTLRKRRHDEAEEDDSKEAERPVADIVESQQTVGLALPVDGKAKRSRGGRSRRSAGARS